MSGFLPEKSVRNEQADAPWMKSDTDKMLDEYFAGASPKRIAQSLGRNPKAIERRIQKFCYNEYDRAVDYHPIKRISRIGKRMTENEVFLINNHRERNISPAVTARVLQRKETEIDGSEVKNTIQINGQKQTAPTLDLIWAHHYLHFRLKKQVITDQAYDDLVREEIEYGGGEKAFARVRASVVKDYPGRIRSLANYLLLTHEGIPDD